MTSKAPIPKFPGEVIDPELEARRQTAQEEMQTLCDTMARYLRTLGVDFVCVSLLKVVDSETACAAGGATTIRMGSEAGPCLMSLSAMMHKIGVHCEEKFKAHGYQDTPEAFIVEHTRDSRVKAKAPD